MDRSLRQTIRLTTGRAGIALALAFAFVCCFLFAGCRLSGDGAGSVAPEVSPSPAESDDTDVGSNDDGAVLPEAPLRYSTQTDEIAGIELRRPMIEVAGAAKVNAAIVEAAREFAEAAADTGLSGDIRFAVKYNDRGLLSLVFTLYNEDGEPEDIRTASFLTATGERLPISACFGACDGSYVFSLSDIVTAKAAEMGLELISYLPPINDERLFYFDGGGMTLVYHRYEICGAEAGMPEVFIGFEDLERYMGADSPLMRVQYFDGHEG